MAQYNIDKNISTPPYQQLLNQIVAKVSSGELAPGDRLPPESELADELGLSRMTINRAYCELQNKGMVERFRKKGTFITAPSLKSNNRNMVVFCSTSEPLRGGSIYNEYLHGFQEICEKRGYTTAVSYMKNPNCISYVDGARGLCYLAKLPSGDPPSNTHVVLLTGQLEENRSLDWVHADNSEGGRIAAEYLLSLGHKRLASFSWYDKSPWVLQRVAAFKTEIQLAGLPIDDRYFPKESPLHSKDVLAKMLNMPEAPTAIFCTSDTEAVRLIAMAGELGVAVPEKLSIISYDGTPLAKSSFPELTTVLVDRVRTGKRAAEILLDRMEGKLNSPAKEIITPVTLRIGKSTRKI